ncbi:site-2 protease family protein [Salibacterium aidingense]|uniref:site-2 protease family protein n=1 Tax=Salibacterium aidingense TaxID=384933 RepID=UPI0004137BA8|nr:site-2 protease family protein [Salibacterium aidingense]
MIKQLRLLHIHPLFWVMAGTAVFTGFFYEIMLLFLIILLHELGHAAAALHYQWRVKQIALLPFGGMMETEEHGNRPVREEVMVTIAGPLVHLPLIALSFLMLDTSFWNHADHSLFLHYNITIFCFNLLPVWPLDGGKLLFCLLSARLPFYKAQKRMWFISCTVLITAVAGLCLYLPFHVQAWLIVLFFIVLHYTEWKQHPYSFFRFLMNKTANPLQPAPYLKKSISWHNRPVDAAKWIGRHGTTSFFIIENGQTLPESYILETITEKRLGMKPLKELLSHHGKD